MQDIEAKAIDSQPNRCLFRKLGANPFPDLVLMTSSSDLP
jgi:hypothetical protein